MKKLLLILIALVCLMTVQVQAAGFTLWSVADQIVDVDEGESIAGRFGYYFGSDEGGLEIAVGSTWHFADKKPQVMSLIVIEHFPDLIDANNPWPVIPGVLTSFINEDVVAHPYAGLEGTFNFVEEDVGFYGGILGVLAKLTPESQIEYGIEGAYVKGFGELEDVDEAQLRLTVRIPF